MSLQIHDPGVQEHEIDPPNLHDDAEPTFSDVPNPELYAELAEYLEAPSPLQSIEREALPFIRPHIELSADSLICFRSYAERGLAIKAFNEQSRFYGFGITIINSKGRFGTATLACWKGGEYRDRVDPAVRKQDAQTVKNGCPYQVKVSQGPDSLWRWQVTANEHNHHHFMPSAIPVHRQIDSKLREKLERLIQAGVTAKRLQTFILDINPHHPILTRDIKNLIFRNGRRARGAQSAAQAAIAKLDSEGDLLSRCSGLTSATWDRCTTTGLEVDEFRANSLRE